MHRSLSTMLNRLAALEATVLAHETALHRRIDDLRREIMAHLDARRPPEREGKPLPWMQLAMFGCMLLTSILGLIAPERAATVLQIVARALAQALLH